MENNSNISEMEFSLSDRAKKISYVLMGVGLISLIITFILDPDHHHNRFWANILVNGFFFFGISLGALFFYALQYATEAAWATLLKRVFEGLMSFLPIGGGVIILVLLLGSFHAHHIYHWMDSSLYYPTLEDGSVNPHYDSVIAGKKAYLNMPFFWLRSLLYIGVFVFFARKFRERSLLEDKVGGTEIHFVNYKKGALFLVLFAVFSSTMAWDWLMSIDTHWFSTMFGWYTFSGVWISAMISSIVLVLYLKSKGHLPQVNENHIHDLGKWMFGISILWSYLWFSQFMLIWYSDIPEEVTYYVERFEHYKIPFISVFFINLLLPLIILMSRDAKRNPKYLFVIGMIIFVAHWADVYLAVMPGVVHDHWHGFFWSEFGIMLGFVGIFTLTVLKTLTKAPLVPVNHPYLDESVHHAI